MMRVMRTLVASIALLAGCGPSTIGDLSRPALVVVITEPGEFCSSVHAVDADGAVWRQASCGDTDAFVRLATTVSAGERATLDAQMDRVLALGNDPDCESPSPSGRRYRFVRTLAGTNEWPEARQCDPAVPTDALDLAAALELLTSPPTDAGLDAGQDGGFDAGPEI